MTSLFEITKLTKAAGSLSKRISLGEDGELRSDGSECRMWSGTAKRLRLADLNAFAEAIGNMPGTQAIALGALRDNLPDEVEVMTKSRREEFNGHAGAKVIARTADHIVYRPNQPSVALIDVDTKGMPEAVTARIEEKGGYWEVLIDVLPGLVSVGRVVRSSTSSGIYNEETGEQFKGSKGQHIFPLLQDGSDHKRFLQVLHDHCWLTGYGWFEIGKAGQLLERSLVDRSVYAPERLVFEGRPVVEPPLKQDQAKRAPVVSDGPPVDSRQVCPDLTPAQRATLEKLKDAERIKLKPQAGKKRAEYIGDKADEIAKRTGMSRADARRIVEAAFGGVLLPAEVLPFDDDELAGCTVGDVLNDPERFLGATMADPLEGLDYGRGKAKIMQRPNGDLWIHSFAHGRTIYELKHDARSIAAAIENADPGDVIDLFIKLLLRAEIGPVEKDSLKEKVRKKSGAKARALNEEIKRAEERQKEQAKAHLASKRTDAKVQKPAPSKEDERTPVIDAIDEVLCAVQGDEPPMRNLDGWPVRVKMREPMGMHSLTTAGSNGEEASNTTRLPPPKLPLLTRHNEASMMRVIEKHITFVRDDDPVALDAVFVDHYMRFDESNLPRVGGVVTTPLVLADGTLLARNGLDRDRRLVFRIEPELVALLPERDECLEQETVVAAMRFLLDKWLVDVSTDFTGKCVLIAAALTILQRALLPERPAFFFTAGRRGGGKTTAASMIIAATTGKIPAAGSWSMSEEERKKAIFAYLREGPAALVWDNLLAGTVIKSQAIEKSLTSPEITDRVLGVSDQETVSATTVQVFTGNNVAPGGELASRSLLVRIEVDRADPENRPFHHQDPIGWTFAHRGAILRALYTILLGNFADLLYDRYPSRFKTWQQLVGSAVEVAVSQLVRVEGRTLPADKRRAVPVDFGRLFLVREQEDEEAAALGCFLENLSNMWPRGGVFTASDLAGYINTPHDSNRERADGLREFLAPRTMGRGGALPVQLTSVQVGKLLRAHLGSPHRVGERTLVLKAMPKSGRGNDAAAYCVTSERR